MGEPVRIYCDGKVVDDHAEIYMICYDAEGKVMACGVTESESCKNDMAAQYLAVIDSLESALVRFGLASYPVEVYLNSKALVKHLSGKWPVKKKALHKLHQRAMAKMSRFSKIKAVFHGKNIKGMVLEEAETQRQIREARENYGHEE